MRFSDSSAMYTAARASASALAARARAASESIRASRSSSCTRTCPFSTRSPTRSGFVAEPNCRMTPGTCVATFTCSGFGSPFFFFGCPGSSPARTAPHSTSADRVTSAESFLNIRASLDGSYFLDLFDEHRFAHAVSRALVNSLARDSACAKRIRPGPHKRKLFANLLDEENRLARPDAFAARFVDRANDAVERAAEAVHLDSQLGALQGCRTFFGTCPGQVQRLS